MMERSWQSGEGKMLKVDSDVNLETEMCIGYVDVEGLDKRGHLK
jgi:hypothetical protein